MMVKDNQTQLPYMEAWGFCRMGQIHPHERQYIKNKCLYGEQGPTMYIPQQTNLSPRDLGDKFQGYITN